MNSGPLVSSPEDGQVILGHVSRAHGVHGALVVTPYGDDPELILTGRNLFLLSPDGLEKRSVEYFKGKIATQGLIVKIKNITTRDAAAALQGWRVAIDRANLPEPAEDEVYLADLIGLTVVTGDGQTVGPVANLIEAGGGLILVVIPPDQPGREILIPYQAEFVVDIDLQGQRLIMDPPPGLLDL